MGKLFINKNLTQTHYFRILNKKAKNCEINFSGRLMTKFMEQNYEKSEYIISAESDPEQLQQVFLIFVYTL